MSVRPIDHDDAFPFPELSSLVIPAAFGRAIGLAGIDEAAAWSWLRVQMRGLRWLRAAAPPLKQGVA